LASTQLFELKRGVQTLDGPTLLAYARDRHDDANGGATDDFARSEPPARSSITGHPWTISCRPDASDLDRQSSSRCSQRTCLRVSATNMQLDQVIKAWPNWSATIDTSK